MKLIWVLILLNGCVTTNVASDAAAWHLQHCLDFRKGDAMHAFWCEDDARRECTRAGLDANCWEAR